MAGDRLHVLVSEAVDRIHPQPSCPLNDVASWQASEFCSGLLAQPHRRRHRYAAHQRAAQRRLASSWAGSGSMTATGDGAACRRCTRAVHWLSWAATIEPPSVVHSCPFSRATSDHCRADLRAMASISAVGGPFKVEGGCATVERSSSRP